MIKKAAKMLVVAGVLAFVLAACTPNDPAPTPGGQQAPTTTAPSGQQQTPTPAAPGHEPRTTFRISTIEEITMIDPHYNTRAVDNTVAWQIFEGFNFVDVRGELEPRLASSFEQSADGMTFTYHLRENAAFHCGHILSADDVLFSFARAKEAPPMQINVASVDTVEAIDNLTVAITLSQVDPMFRINGNIAIMCHICGADVEPGFNYPSIGTGPYMIGEWGDGRRVVKERFDDWHMQHVLGWLPQIETQITYVLVDQTTQMMALEADDIDYLSIPAPDWDRVVASGNFTYFTQQSWHTTYIVFNNLRAPFDDVRVRQAFNYAVNQADVALAAREGLADAAFMMGNPYYIAHLQNLTEDPDFYRFDFNPDRARELLAEAGFPDGLVLDEPLGTFPTGHLLTAAEVVQQQLAEVGITTRIETGDPATYFQDLNLGNFFFAVSGWSWTTPDAFWTERRFATDHIGDVNSAHYSNPEVDALFEIARTSMDQEVRRQAFRDAFKIVSRDAVIIPLYYQYQLFAWHTDFTADPNRPRFEWFWN